MLIQEIDLDWELNSLDNNSGDINPYRELIVNNVKEVGTVLTKMEQWSMGELMLRKELTLLSIITNLQ